MKRRNDNKAAIAVNLQSTGLSFRDNADGTLDVYAGGDQWINYRIESQRWTHPVTGERKQGCLAILKYCRNRKEGQQP